MLTVLSSSKMWYWYFIFDFFACVPPELFLVVLGDGAQSFNQAARLARINRIARLAQLVRITRLSKFTKVLKRSLAWKQFLKVRGFRIVTSFLSLLLVVHILACGWYLCAVVNGDYAVNDTWLVRRGVDNLGTTLLEETNVMAKWVHAMYFVLTVFTSVGFGDMYPVTTLEICYTLFVMIVGAVVHSIIISEVISICTSLDEVATEQSRKQYLIEGFVRHMKIPDEVDDSLKDWLAVQKSRGEQPKYDRVAMEQMLTDGTVPSVIVQKIPPTLYSGLFQRNQFMTICRNVCGGTVPSKLPLALALRSWETTSIEGDVIYQVSDHPVHFYLVLRGTYAYVSLAKRVDHQTSNELLKLGTMTHVARDFQGDARWQGTSPANAATLATPSGMSHASGSSSTKKPSPPSGTPQSASAFDAMRSKLEKTAHDVEEALTSTFRAHSLNMRTCGNLDDERSNSRERWKLCPYRLFGHGSYFGDFEIAEKKEKPRQACARCESAEGSLLVIAKGDLLDVLVDFPHVKYAMWRCAQRREWHRLSRLSRLSASARRGHVPHGGYRDFAAITIQRFFHGNHGKKAGASGHSISRSQLGRARTASDVQGAARPSPATSPPGGADDTLPVLREDFRRKHLELERSLGSLTRVVEANSTRQRKLQETADQVLHLLESAAAEGIISCV